MEPGADKPTTEQGRKEFSLWSELPQNPSLLPFVGELRSALRGCRSVLDIGCGGTSPMRFVRGLRLTGMDGYEPALRQARENRTHDEYRLGNVIRLRDAFVNRRFDACVALDVIEHLQKEDGWRLLEEMEALAEVRVIVATPNGFMPQASKDGDLQEHLSGWTADELQKRGYRVLGMYGPKSLRGEYHRIVRRPRAFWTVVSMLLHYVDTRQHPGKAAALFCIREMVKPSQ